MLQNSGWGSDFFDYVNSDEELSARKMSTLFYLKKIGQNYTNISKSQVDDLYKNINKLPSDIKQLLIIYDNKREDLTKWLNNKQ